MLKSGDRFTGSIFKMENKRLEIEPPYSDIVKIKWEDVRSSTSDRPLSLPLFEEVDAFGFSDDSKP